MRPFFSIIIPTLNEELFVSKLLNDLSLQKEQNFEVIVVDGGSEDKTELVANKFVNKIPLNFIIHKAPYVSYQRNLGAKKAQSSFLIFLDADMSVTTTFTKTAEQQVRKRKGLIYIPCVFPLEKKEFPEVDMIFPLINKLIEFSQNLSRPFSAGPCTIWHKHIFETVGGFEHVLAEDHDIIRKAHAWGITPKFLPRIKVLFSLRRMKREGRMQLLYKLIVSHFYLLFNEKINKKLFTYELGGHLYKQVDDKYKQSPQFIIKKIRAFFQEILE